MILLPKEKAIELVNKFSNVGLQQRNEGIACALIAVDEILQTCVESYNYNICNTSILSSIYFWQEVRQEIQKL